MPLLIVISTKGRNPLRLVLPLCILQKIFSLRSRDSSPSGRNDKGENEESKQIHLLPAFRCK